MSQSGENLQSYFPSGWNRRLAGLDFNDNRNRKFSVVFQDFGSLGHVDVRYSDSESQWKPEFTTQRQGKSSKTLSQIPALPLSTTPVKVSFPFTDRVMGDLWTVPDSVLHFQRSLAKTVSCIRNQQKPKWYNRLFTAKKTLDTITDATRVSEAKLDIIENNLPKSIRDLITQYRDLANRDCYADFNVSYSGGSLACITGGDKVSYCNDHLLIHAQGLQSERLMLTFAQPSVSCPGLVRSRTVAESFLPSIFQVTAQTVEGNVYMGVRHKSSCSVFSLPDRTEDWCILDTGQQVDGEAVDGHLPQTETELNAVGMYHFPEGTLGTSVSVSPYLAGECLFCSDDASVYLWSAERGVHMTLDRPTRFECRDMWLHAYYASHPRHIVVADRTAVQLMDHRDGFHSTVDLFALPSSLVHPQERVLAATHHHGFGSPLHIISTGHSVLVVDQRFAGTPVMQWYPDTKGPVLYLDSAYIHNLGGESDDDSSLVLLGSQYPAEVMCYSLSQRHGRPVTSPFLPQRLSQMSDVMDSRYADLLSCMDCAVLKERLDMSLAGMAIAAPVRKSGPVVMYQRDCYGELFYQALLTPSHTSSSPRNAHADSFDPKQQKVTPHLQTVTQSKCPSQTPSMHRSSNDSDDSTKSQWQAFESHFCATSSGDVVLPSWVQQHVRTWVRQLRAQVDSLQFRDAPSLGSGSTLVATWNLSGVIGDKTRTENIGGGSNSPLHRFVEEVSSPHKSKTLNTACDFCHNSAEKKRMSEELLLTRSISANDFENTTENPFLLDQVAPAVETYKMNASTNLHLRLMKGWEDDHKEELQEIVKQREDERLHLLEEYKEWRRERRQCKRARLMAATEHSARLDTANKVLQQSINSLDKSIAPGNLKHRVLSSAGRLENVDQHQPSVFHSEEHLKQNARIREILESNPLDTGPHTLSLDESMSCVDSENTPPDYNSSDASRDLFDSPAGMESKLEYSQLAGRSAGDDDDEFFSVSTDLGLSQLITSPATCRPLSQSSSVLSPSVIKINKEK